MTMTVRFRGSTKGQKSSTPAEMQQRYGILSSEEVASNKQQGPAKIKFAQDDDRASLMKSEEGQDSKKHRSRDVWKKSRSMKLTKKLKFLFSSKTKKETKMKLTNVLGKKSNNSNIVQPGIRLLPLEGEFACVHYYVCFTGP